MIYLAASDMDGTLLTSSGELPPHFWEFIEALREKGVTFAVASGRSYEPLMRKLGENSDKLTFICDNGACVVENGEVIYKDLVSSYDLRVLIKTFSDHNRTRAEGEKMTMALCGVHGTYHLGYDEKFEKDISNYYDNQVRLSDLIEVEDEIYKAAIYDPLDPQTGSYEALSHALPQMNFQVSGRWWMDVMNAGTDKGKALRMIADKKGITRDQIAAFGDFYNDVSLFREAEHSFVMENGDEGVRKYARFVAPSNDAYGVVTVLQKLCELDKGEFAMKNEITHASEREVTVNYNKAGGYGHVDIEHLLSDEQKNGKTKMFARVIIPAGCSLGYHEHHGESETYYILKGEGEYNDNGVIKNVKAGDVTFTPSGHGHGLVNNTEQDIEFMALIQLD